MSLGFIILRHVNSKITDYYWKESYTAIRKFYDNPIMIIDDSSNKEFLNENIILQNCTVIYDKEHKGAGELLPYYYFNKLKPFDTAVIIHDSVFIQKKIDFTLNDNENIRFLWSFSHDFDDFYCFSNLITEVFHSDELLQLYEKKDLWFSFFGIMSIIKWDFLHKVDEKHQLFNKLLPKINSRINRCGLERLLALIFFCNDNTIKPAHFGDIFKYIQWGITFNDYMTNNYSNYPIVKVWSGR